MTKNFNNILLSTDPNLSKPYEENDIEDIEQTGQSLTEYSALYTKQNRRGSELDRKRIAPYSINNTMEDLPQIQQKRPLSQSYQGVPNKKQEVYKTKSFKKGR